MHDTNGTARVPSGGLHDDVAQQTSGKIWQLRRCCLMHAGNKSPSQIARLLVVTHVIIQFWVMMISSWWVMENDDFERMVHCDIQFKSILIVFEASQEQPCRFFECSSSSTNNNSIFSLMDVCCALLWLHPCLLLLHLSDIHFFKKLCAQRHA